MKPALLVLAAGIGSRYGGFKQIDPIGPNGEFIIDYSIHDALRAGFGKIVILTQRALEQPIREHFAATLGTNFELAFAFQELGDLPGGFTLPEGRQKPWGTGHAVWAARKELDRPFGVINADDFYGPQSYRLLHAFLADAGEDLCMVGYELARTLSDYGTVSRGICHADAEGYLVDIVEHTKIERDGRSLETGQTLPKDAVASMNLWGLAPSILPSLEKQFCAFLAEKRGDLKAEFFLPTAVGTLIQEGRARCKVLKTDDQWFGVTYKEDRPIAVETIGKLIKAGVYPASLQ